MLRKLKLKQDELEKNYKSDFSKLKSDIERFSLFLEEGEKNVVSPKLETEKVKPKATSTISYATTQPIKKAEPTVNPIVAAAPNSVKTIPTPKAKPVQKQVVREPSELEQKTQAVLEQISQLTSFVSNAYNKYKAEGKLPIFFMTIAGLVAILFGIGYLMQNSFEYLGIYADPVKVGSGFLASLVVGAIGFRLYNKDEKYKEFGSALISLSIILNYLLVYFLSDLGHFPILSSAVLGFTLIVANTIAAISITLKFNTKIISVLSLIGGAFTPFFLNSTEDGSLYYFYLWLLTAASCYVANSIKWKVLQHLAFVISATLLGMTIFSNAISELFLVTYYHLFAYLFFYVSLFKKAKIKEKLERVDLIVLMSNLSLLILNLFFLFERNLLNFGWILLANACILMVPLLLKWKSLSKEVRLLFLIVIGSLIGFTIPALFDEALMGLFWSVEGIGLLLVGFIFKEVRIRKESYFVLAIAYGKLLVNSFVIISDWDEGILHAGFVNFIVLGLVTMSLWLFGQKYKAQFQTFETRIFSVFKELSPVWLAAITLLIAYHFLGNWSLNLTVLPMAGLIYWQKRFGSKFSASIGLTLLSLYFVAFVISVTETHSMRLSEQKLFAQVAMGEMFLTLWALKFYFEQLKITQSKLFTITQNLRVVFFCLIPLIIIYETNKHFEAYLIVGIWLAVMVAYLLHKKLKYKALLSETHLLFFITVPAAFYLEELNLPSAVASLLCMNILFFMEKGQQEKYFKSSAFKTLLAFIPPLFAVTTGAIVGIITDSFGVFSATFALILLVFALTKDHVAVFNSGKITYIQLAFVASFITLIALGFTSRVSSIAVTYVVVNMFLFGILLVNRKQWYDKVSHKNTWATNFILYQLLAVSTYSFIINLAGIELDGPLYSIVLVVHAITLLFIALKTRIKLLNISSVVLFASALLKVLFNDIRDFATNEKVIVFILIGVLLLGASFLYVKLKAKFDEQLKTEEKPEI